jgi:hypothetical protein
VRTFEQWAERYRATRIDYAAETTKNMASHLKMLNSVFGQHDPATITTADVQEWIAASKLKTGSLRRYLATLRALLDFAGVEPNPARDGRVKVPRSEQTTVEPPSGEQVEAIIAHSPTRWHLPLRVLEQTGMRWASCTGSSGATSTWPVVASVSVTARRPRLGAGSRFHPGWWSRSRRRARRTIARPNGECSLASPRTWLTA